MQNAEKKFEAMSAHEKCKVITEAASELVYKFYCEQDKEGLEILSREFSSLSTRIKNCVDCLDFLKKQGEVFAKIWLLLEFLGRDGMNEKFVEQLEELAENARDRLEDDEVTPADEAKCLRNIRSVMNQHYTEWLLEEMNAEIPPEAPEPEKVHND